MKNKDKTKILIVCMGNICRSPTGEAVLKATAERLNIPVEVDSAGTISFHAGSEPDYRARTAGEKRGYSFKGMEARQVIEEDFEYYDLILAADRDNMGDLLSMCPVDHVHKIKLFLGHYHPEYDEIPDPYYGGDDGFELVLDLIEEASETLLRKIQYDK
ncbi:low molecular weight phosphotyrosine protein phosphatase [Vibrio sp. JC009]|uniref:low molecular weight protein-tyrosine-phosphatase n=1 Tax=Vibrio sp. JC009 TaxID=2912314 RepID=UPI0023B0A02B|nr:low molecular weight protein-tyrosine-phosphatase [Vibrio sp. JC009]WED22661.1 low molecular weight phosphotyrosine protein phosphatase [Vibrio sp. JC009]